MVPTNGIPRIAIRPTGDFKPFANEEIEQSIPQRFEQQVRAYSDRVALNPSTKHLPSHRLIGPQIDWHERSFHIETSRESRSPYCSIMARLFSSRSWRC